MVRSRTGVFAATVIGVAAATLLALAPAAGAQLHLPVPLPLPGNPAPDPASPAPGGSGHHHHHHQHHGNHRGHHNPVSVKVSPAGAAALVRTIPIRRRLNARPVSVLSLPLRKLGRMRRRVRLETGGELEVTVCLRRSIGRSRDAAGCAGRIYRYDPKIRVRLVLASGPRVVDPRFTAALGRPRTVRCTQHQPNRNHHCAIDLGWHRTRFGPGAHKLPPCAPRHCRVNLIASAASPHARRHQRVAVGGIRDNGKVDNRGESRIAAIRYGRRLKRPRPLAARRALTRALPLVPDNHSIHMRSVYSVRIPHPRAGEQLRIAGRYLGALAHLPYNARTRTQLILADGPRSVRPGRHARRVAASPVFLSTESNFNCTRGRSAHHTPCPIAKVGVTRFGASSKRPVYVNLLAGEGALGDRHRRSDRVRVRRGGYLKVWRFAP